MEGGESPPPAKKRCLGKAELEGLSKEELIGQYLSMIDQKQLASNFEVGKSMESWNSTELVCLRESEEKLKQQQIEATRRENVLVMRLATKEQEMQECMNQIQELKQSQMPSVSQLRSSLTDPAVNLLFERLKKELESTKAKLEETQNELSAWKFTPDSNTGKRLMAKCRLLYQENEELGKIISSGKMAKLEGDLALQKSFSEEMKKSESEQYEYLVEVEEEVEGMQSTIVFLQKQLQETKEQMTVLEKENNKLMASIGALHSNNDDDVHEDKLRTTTDDSRTIIANDKVEADESKFNNQNVVNSDSCNIETSPRVSVIAKNVAKNSDSLQNGEHIVRADGRDPRHAHDDSWQNDEPMDTSTNDRTENSPASRNSVNDVDALNRTSNGKETSSELRTKEGNHGVDSDTEVQVAQTLASWANCENDSDLPINSKSSKIVGKESSVV